MRNVNSDVLVTNEQRLLDAMNAYINEPAKPLGFTLKESVINLLGGPADAVGNEYDYRDTCEMLLSLVEKNPDFLMGRRACAVFFLKSAVGFFNDCITSESLRAEIHRNVIEVYGFAETADVIENLIKQYELKRQLILLEAEASKLQKKAA